MNFYAICALIVLFCTSENVACSHKRPLKKSRAATEKVLPVLSLETIMHANITPAPPTPTPAIVDLAGKNTPAMPEFPSPSTHTSNVPAPSKDLAQAFTAAVPAPPTTLWATIQQSLRNAMTGIGELFGLVENAAAPLEDPNIMMTRSFKNPSNLCFINATMQGILSSPAHFDFLRNFNRTNIATDTLLDAFFNTLDAYYDVSKANNALPNDDNFNFAFKVHQVMTRTTAVPDGEIIARPAGIRQQDIGELYVKLIDQLNTYNQTHGFDALLGKTTLTTTRTCEHGHLRQVDEEHSLVTIELPDQAETITVNALLTRFQQAEELGDVECPSCGCIVCGLPESRPHCTCHKIPGIETTPRYRRSVCHKRIMIKPSTHLVLNLKRTTIGATGEIKIHTPVVAEKEIIIDGKRFAITGLVFHSGEAHVFNDAGNTKVSGHYTTLKRSMLYNPDTDSFSSINAWTYCNDAQLILSNELPRLLTDDKHPFINAARGYEVSMLFYERIA